MARKRGDIDDELVPPIPLVRRKGRPTKADKRSLSEMRECKRHGNTEYHRYRSGTDDRGKVRYRWICKRCLGEAVTRRKQKLKQMLVDEAGGCCAVCGYDACIINLHFHHVDPAKKCFAMTMALGKSIATFRAEAKKCVLVCANCHGEIEAGLIEGPPAGTKFSDVWHGRPGRRRAA